jgi:hypothetical protein
MAHIERPFHIVPAPDATIAEHGEIVNLGEALLAVCHRYTAGDVPKEQDGGFILRGRRDLFHDKRCLLVYTNTPTDGDITKIAAAVYAYDGVHTHRLVAGYRAGEPSPTLEHNRFSDDPEGQKLADYVAGLDETTYIHLNEDYSADLRLRLPQLTNERKTLTFATWSAGELDRIVRQDERVYNRRARWSARREKVLEILGLDA